MAYKRKTPYKNYNGMIQEVSKLKVHPHIEYFFDDITGDKWEDFLESVRMNGIMTPLIVTPQMVILSGRQRYRACLELGIEDVVVEIVTIDFPEDEDRIIIESNIRQRGIVNSPSIKLGRIVTALEEITGNIHCVAGSYIRVGNGIHRKGVYETLGIAKKVANCSKSIVKMPEELQELIDEGIVAPRVAYDHLAKLSVEEQEAMARTIRTLVEESGEKKVTTDQVKKLLNKAPTKGELPMLQTDSEYFITRDIWGQPVVISLTQDEAITIARQVFEKSLKPVQEPEPELKWKPVKAYATGVMAQNGAEAIKMYEAGVSCHKIAEHFGVTDSTASRFLRNSGVKMRTPQDANRLRWANRNVA